MHKTYLRAEKKKRRDTITNGTHRKFGVKNVIELDEKQLQWSGHGK
jgi:hypothetical protein